MRGFFGLEGPFNKYAGFLADMLILSLLWLLCSIPVITIGASSTALYYVSTRRIANRERYITSDFWKAFKSNFLRATVLWVPILIITVLILFAMLAGLEEEVRAAMPLGSIVFPVQVLMLLQILFMTRYIFAITARFDMSIKETLKSAFWMANRHLLTSILCSALLIFIVAFALFVPQLAIIIIIAPGVYGMVASYLLMKVFRKYRPEMDPDPVLELQEIERKRNEEKRREALGLSPLDAEKIKEEDKMKTYELTNENGMKMTVTNLGCAIISLTVPARGGEKDIVLGLDEAEDYKGKHPFFGVVVGRFANRIGDGRFSLSGKEYQLEKNENGVHHLHGGADGFDKKLWDIESFSGGKIVFTLHSPDGDSGYPGDLTARITYLLTEDNALRIDYEATTETETICNLTNHSYFNLCGHDAKDVYSHELQIFSDKITEVDAGLIPTGGFVDITDTPFDFRTAKAIGKDIKAAGKVNNTGGYDHNYVLNGEGTAAAVYSPETGIRMTVKTDSPGMQLYTGNFIDGTVTGKGVTYKKHSGFCLETQLFPDGINKPDFPSCVVKKGEPQKFYTEFVFEW